MFWWPFLLYKHKANLYICKTTWDAIFFCYVSILDAEALEGKEEKMSFRCDNLTNWPQIFAN